MKSEFTKFDLHIHTQYSDGTDSVQELVEKLKSQAIEYFAICDHDNISAIPEIRKMNLQELGISFATGVEISCEQEYTYHILGYGFDEKNSQLKDLLKKNNSLAKEKMLHMIEFIKKEYGIVLDNNEIERLMQKEAPRKPALAQILCDKGVTNDLESAIHNYLNNFVPSKKYYVTVSEAVEAIHNAGGYAIWSHPLRAKGHGIHSTLEFQKRFQNIKELIDGLEVFYSKFTMEQCNYLYNVAAENKLLVSAGSDYHGRFANAHLGQVNKENETVDINRILIMQKIF